MIPANLLIPLVLLTGNYISTHKPPGKTMPPALHVVMDEPPARVTDIDGNVYGVIKIGRQVWMAVNLKTTRYRNGDPIPFEKDNRAWTESTNGAFTWYDNNDTYRNTAYGALYNFYAATDERGVCPAGWHVPSHDEWTELNEFLGGYLEAGGALKEEGTKHWITANGNNRTGFTALPAGYRNSKGGFSNMSGYTYWWSSTEFDTNTAWNRNIIYNNADFSTAPHQKKLGFSIRCIKD